MEQEQEAPPAKKAKPSDPQPHDKASHSEEDWLSALGDDTLHEILARLPLRDAAVATALSTRWPRVFATLPRLCLGPATFNSRASLGIDYCDDNSRWVDALDRVLNGRLSPVAVFELDAGLDLLEGHDDWFHSILSTLCRSGALRHLALRNENVHECYPVPSPVYACTTLTSLELDGCHLRRVPAAELLLTGLRGVRSLVLRRVVAADADLRRVLSRCVAVERLVLEECHRVRSVVVRGPSLREVEVHSYRPLRVAVRSAPLLETARLSLGYGVAESSWSVYNDSDGETESKTGDLDQLEEELYEFETQERREQRIRKTDEAANMVAFLSGLGSAKELCLHLPYDYAEVLRKTSISLPMRLPKKCCLRGLQKLTLDLNHNDEAIATLVSCILNSSPNLNNLEITNDCFYDRCTNRVLPDIWEKNIGAAECVQYRLLTVTFYLNVERFHDRSYIDLSKFLLTRARALERLSIKYRHLQLQDQDQYTDKLENAQSELRLWPRASPAALVEIHPVDRLPSCGGLRELSITNTKYTECYSLPTPVYNCKTLVSLELYNWRIRVPGRVTGLRSLQSLSLLNVVATDAEIRRMILLCRDMARLEITRIHKARKIVIQAPNLEKLDIDSFRPLCVSVKKGPAVGIGVDTMDTDEDYSFSEIEERCDFQRMSEREYKKTDEVRNMVTFLGGLRCAKDLRLYLPPEYARVLSMAKVPMPERGERLPKKCYLLGLRKLALTLDHNDEALATIVSCLFNSCPNLKDLRIHGSQRAGYAVPLAAEFWEEQIDADCCVQNHLSTVTFYIDSFSQSNPCRDLCQFLVMNARVLQRLCGSGGLLELTITNTKYNECYALPIPVYNCKTLVSLELYNWRIRVPGRATGLRSLMSLSLRNVVATDDEIRRMISLCREVERLEICDLHKARDVVIQAPNLEKLEIQSFRPLCVSVKKAPRLESVRLSLSYCWPEFHWRGDDTMDSDEEYSLSEIEKRCDFPNMAKREYRNTDEVRNMVTFLRGLGCAKDLRLNLSTEYVEVMRMAKVPMPKRLPKKFYLLGLQTLSLSLDHNDEVIGTLVSCLFNSSPNLRNLKIKGSLRSSYTVPLATKFWENHIDADCCVQNHLSTVTFYVNLFSESNPCRGLCQFLVMNARILQRGLFAELCKELTRGGPGGLLELGIWNTKYSDGYDVPPAVFDCRTLTKLELFSCRIRVPARLAGLRAVRSLQLRSVVASDADIRRMITQCRAVEDLLIQDIHKARHIVIRAPNLERLDVASFRPLRVSVKNAPRLATAELGLCYDWAQYSWTSTDTMDSDRDYSFSEIDERCDFEKMEKREHEKTDEVGNMVIFLGGLGRVSKLRLYLSARHSKMLSKAKVPLPKRLPEKFYLLGLQILTLTLDHNLKTLATFVSCLLNSSPNLKDLRIVVVVIAIGAMLFPYLHSFGRRK
uniref:F-box/LRR-repeat protein 15/At3g58940/PEG3-like LRR domain-containing protein n=1 Tax=Leersia perrieri TaxID=77586 RepID=A0A0D9V4X6_9ORYZ